MEVRDGGVRELFQRNGIGVELEMTLFPILKIKEKKIF